MGPSCQDQPGWAVRSPKVQPSLVAGRLAGSGSQDQPVLVAGSGKHDQPVLIAGSGPNDQSVLITDSLHRTSLSW